MLGEGTLLILDLVPFPLHFSDTLFYEDFSLSSAINRFHSSSCPDNGGAVVVCYQCEDSGK